MIKVIQTRLKDGEVFGPDVRDVSIADALDMLVNGEMRFGGMFTSAVPAAVEIVTIVMGCRDTTRFEGTPKDMELLYACAVIWGIMTKRNLDENGSMFSAGEIRHAAQRSGGNAGVLAMGAEILASSGRVRTIYTCLLAESPEDIARYSGFSANELFDLVCLKRIEGEDITCLIPQ